MKENTNHQDEMRTIIADTIAGRAIQTCQDTLYIKTRGTIEPTQALGCSIKNAKLKSSRFEEMNDQILYVRVNGEFDLHVWVEVNEDTKVTKRTIRFSDVIPVESLEGTNYYEEGFDNKTIIPWLNKEPVSLGTMVVNRAGVSEISIEVEYEIGVEILEKTRMNVLSVIVPDTVEEEPLLDPELDEENNYEDVD